MHQGCSLWQSTELLWLGPQYGQGERSAQGLAFLAAWPGAAQGRAACSALDTGWAGWCLQSFCKTRCQSTTLLPAAPVLPGSGERHSLLIGLGTPSGNGNVLTYYSLMSCAETKQACPKPVLDVRKIMLECECRHVSGMVSTMLLKEDFPGLSLV